MKPFPGQFALAQPFRSPDEEGGASDPAFVERPEDRESAAEPEREAEHEEPATPDENDAGGQSEDDGAGEGTQSGDAGGDEVAASGAEADDEDAETPKRRDWGMKRRLDKLTAQTKTLEQQRDEAVARAKTLEELYAKPEAERTDGEREAIKQNLRAEVAQEVRQEARIREINSKADKLFDDGKAAFPKTWERRVSNIGELFGEDLQKRPDFFEAVTELDNAPAVWHELGNDPETMDRLLGLTPAKMGIELARISTKLAVPKAPVVSKTPPPIKPLQDLAREDRPLEDVLNDPKASMKEIDRRMAAVEKRRLEERGGRR